MSAAESTYISDYLVLREKQRYRVDLRKQQAECEANYARLSKLLPLLEQQAGEGGDTVCFGLRQGEVFLKVLEKAPYTTTLEVVHCQQPCEQGGYEWSKAPHLKVRMYHDASMAEVVACEGHRHLKPRLPYPHPKGYHVDEKAQWNVFLGEWLSHCLEQGFALAPQVGY
ncbi:MAG: DUF1249 domain-containing protein [Cellvibrionaceae bacterium]